MSKNPVSKPKPDKRNEPMRRALACFIIGCAAELYLLLIRKFYVNGTADQVLALHEALPYLAAAGGAAAAVGLILGILWRQMKGRRAAGWCVCAAGAFVGVSALMTRVFYDSALMLLCVVVPVAMLLGILWNLYARECAWSLTILGVSLIALWVCRRGGESIYLGIYVKAAVAAYIVLLAVAALLAGRASGAGGKLGRFQVLTSGADPLPVYLACALSAAALAVALFSSALAYYAMWALAIVVFALAVYYTVKQL